MADLGLQSTTVHIDVRPFLDDVYEPDRQAKGKGKGKGKNNGKRHEKGCGLDKHVQVSLRWGSLYDCTREYMIKICAYAVMSLSIFILTYTILLLCSYTPFTCVIIVKYITRTTSWTIRIFQRCCGLSWRGSRAPEVT